jgi:hypothetical protein
VLNNPPFLIKFPIKNRGRDPVKTVVTLKELGIFVVFFIGFFCSTPVIRHALSGSAADRAPEATNFFK